MKLPVFAVAAACVAALSAAPAAAQIDPVSQGQLEAAVEMMGAEGYTLQGGFRGGALRSGAEETIRIDLQAGTSYAIIGVCDGDCSDMDFFLADPNGTAISQDIAEDDVPIVTAETTRAGSYQLRITMPGCSVDPCGYGVAVFAQS